MKLTRIAENLRESSIQVGQKDPDLEHFEVAEANAMFVDPDLKFSEQDAPDSREVQVTAIVARGAAGKSECAASLSAATNAPLWRTNLDLTLNGYSLERNLSKYTQNTAPDRLIRGLENPLIIIDALDESQARVSLEAWQEFLGSLIEYIRLGLRIVLVGRDNVIRDVLDQLSDKQISSNIAELGPMAGLQRNLYVKKRLEYIYQKNVSRMPRISECVDQLLMELDQASGEGDTPASFSGYPPVLNVIAAEAASIDNPSRFLEKTTDQSKLVGPRWIEAVCTQVLLREQKKVVKQLANNANANLAYTIDEQIDLLLEESLLSPEVEPPAQFTEKEKHDYLKVRNSFVLDHPFRTRTGWASTVFEAYCFSRRIDKIREVSELLRVGRSNPTLFTFACLDQDTIYTEESVSAIHSSAVSAFTRDLGSSEFAERATAIISSTGDPNLMRYEFFKIGSDGQAGATICSVEFRLQDSDVLRFFGALSFLDIIAPGRIAELRTGERAPHFGPFFFCYSDLVAFGFNELKVVRLYMNGRKVPSAVIAAEPLSELPMFDPGPGDENPIRLIVKEDRKLAWPWNSAVYQIKAPGNDGRGLDYSTMKIITGLSSLNGKSGNRKIRTSLHGWMAGVGLSPRSEGANRVVKLLESEKLVRVRSETIEALNNPRYPLFRTGCEVYPSSGSEFVDLDVDSRAAWIDLENKILEILE